MGKCLSSYCSTKLTSEIELDSVRVIFFRNLSLRVLKGRP